VLRMIRDYANFIEAEPTRSLWIPCSPTALYVQSGTAILRTRPDLLDARWSFRAAVAIAPTSDTCAAATATSDDAMTNHQDPESIVPMEIG
jgi:hypothetical protein